MPIRDETPKHYSLEGFADKFAYEDVVLMLTGDYNMFVSGLL